MVMVHRRCSREPSHRVLLWLQPHDKETYADDISLRELLACFFRSRAGVRILGLGWLLLLWAKDREVAKCYARGCQRTVGEKVDTDVIRDWPAIAGSSRLHPGSSLMERLSSAVQCAA